MSPYIDPATRDRIRAGAESSAVELGKLFIDLFAPSRTLDVGCGEGYLTQYMRDHDVQAWGVDGDPGPMVDASFDMTRRGRWPDYPGGKLDLVTCLEVAEHLPESAADLLVEKLVGLGQVVAFSAAIPYQTGPGHINEKPPRYWAEKFEQYGYDGTGALRWLIWDRETIEPWYRQNLLVFAPRSTWTAGGSWVELIPRDGCPYVVHPMIWELFRK